MRHFALLLSIVILIVLGVGCSRLVATPSPSPIPLDDISTQVQGTLQAGQNGSPTVTPTPPGNPSTGAPVLPTSLSSPTPSQLRSSPTALAFDQTPTATPSPTTTATSGPSSTPNYRATRTPTVTRTPTMPAAGVQINEPGPMSRLASPLHLTGNLRTVPSGNYRIELWIEPLEPGNQPRLLYREVQRLISNPVDWLYLDQQIQFELSRVSELGQLRITVLDTFNRAVSINSVDLILLQMGPSDITPSAGKNEPIVIREPTPNQLIQGGKVIVSGIVRPDSGSMLVELVGIDGSVVGYNEVFVTPSPTGDYVPYTIEVPYSVSTPTWVRLQISESGTRITGTSHLSSVVVLLSP